MARVLAPVTGLLLGVMALVFGQGILSLLVTLKVDQAGAPLWVTGAMTSSYYLGLAMGSVACGRLIARLGHARAFGCFAALMALAALGFAATRSHHLWMALRWVDGACIAGTLLVSDSWVNERATPTTRGLLMALYMAAYYLAMGMGQLAPAWLGLEGARPFIAVAACFGLAALPVLSASHHAPAPGGESRIDVGALMSRAPLGLLGSLVSGLTLGGLFGLGPVFGRAVGLSIEETGHLMSTFILGGLLLQWPLGRLSDRMDRRKVLVGAGLASGICAALVAATSPGWSLLLGAVALGGLLATLYPVAIGHANDRLTSRERVPAAGALVLATGLGSILGPQAATLTMSLIGPAGLPWSIAGWCLLLSLAGLWSIAADSPSRRLQPSAG